MILVGDKPGHAGGLAEREGFEPPVPFDITVFQDQRLKPLGHLSPDETAKIIIAESKLLVNAFLAKSRDKALVGQGTFKDSFCCAPPGPGLHLSGEAV